MTNGDEGKYIKEFRSLAMGWLSKIQKNINLF
jgi:hypothetical protein